MQKLLLIFISLGIIQIAFGQDLPPIDKVAKPDILTKMDYTLYKWQSTMDEAESIKAVAKDHGIYVRSDGKLKLEVLSRKPYEEAINTEELVQRGLEVDGSFRKRCNVWVDPDELLATAEKLPEQHFLYLPVRPVHDRVDNEGPSLMNSSTYTTAGTGINIAVIDDGFDEYTIAANAGAVPPVADITYYGWGNGALEAGTNEHGTACTETAFDHAPNASYFLHKTFTLTDLGNAINQCITDGIDVITHSQSWYNTGFADDSGDACAAANTASDNDILFFTSAGNRADAEHDQRDSFNDDDNDGFYNWTAGDELNNLTVDPGCTVRFYLMWEGVPDDIFDDYDLYLYNVDNQEIDASLNTDDFEELTYMNTSGLVRTIKVGIKQEGQDDNAFELFVTDRGCDVDLQFSVTDNSTTSPSNATGDYVFVTGAVARGNYTVGNGGNAVMAYSGRGPTNGGFDNIDFAGPTNTTTVAYNGPFTGTSCATPNMAGAVAALWSAHPFLSAEGVREIMKGKAEVYMDWGPAGLDNDFGFGGLYLYDYHVNNRFIFSDALNFDSDAALPYYSMFDVNNDSGVPTNRRMIYLDKNDVKNPGATGVIDRAMIYDSATGTVID